MQPGIYIFKNKSGQTIYVGKAKLLKSRVSSYFRNVANHKPKVYKMVSEAYDFEFIVADTEFDAIMLEWNMIKERRPKYNILIKNDKGYSYIKVSPAKMDSPGDPWSKITAERRRDDDKNALFFGPYASSFVVKETVEEVNDIFSLPTCSKVISASKHGERPCLNYYIKKCNGACCGKISFDDYRLAIENACGFIKNGGEESIKHLSELMEEAAENLEFEKAAVLRDSIATMKRNSLKQAVPFCNIASADAVAVAEDNDNICISVLKIRKERVVDKDEFVFESMGDRKETLSSFLPQYYSGENIPDSILLYEGTDDLEETEKLINSASHRRKKVRISVPVKSENRKITEMAYSNAIHRLSHDFGRVPKNVAALDELGKLLGIKSPARIEAYDISNIGSDTIIGGMTVFENGLPLKSHYRKFRMKDVVSVDDYSSMRQMIRRRFNEYLSDKNDLSFSACPDLLLIDGGNGHVSAVKEVLESLGITVPVFGMVKDEKHRTRAISADGGEITMRETDRAFRLVTEIQNETHRFAISYASGSHLKNSLSLSITKVSGIGKKRAETIMKHYKTLKALRAASPEEIARLPGIPLSAAQNLSAFLKGEI